MARENWSRVLRQLLAGDRVAFAKVGRVVTGTLAGIRAYDFRDEWDDLVQEVVWIVVDNARQGKIEDPGALAAYVRTTTRQTFRAHLAKAKRLDYADDMDEKPETLHWPCVASGPDTEELWEQVARLPERQRRAIEARYRDGRTGKEASEATGIPLGSLKRYLTDGIETLRRRMLEGETVEPLLSDHSTKGVKRAEGS